MGEGHHNAALDFQAIFRFGNSFRKKSILYWICKAHLRFTQQTVWKLRRITHTFIWQKFREIHVFTIEMVVILTKYFYVESEFHVFQHCATPAVDFMFYAIFMNRLQILWYVTSKSSKWRENWLVVFPENCLCHSTALKIEFEKKGGFSDPILLCTNFLSLIFPSHKKRT